MPIANKSHKYLAHNDLQLKKAKNLGHHSIILDKQRIIPYMKKQTVAMGLLGTTLDKSPARGERWKAWRPTIAICQHDDLVLDRLELLYTANSASLFEQVSSDIRAVSPETQLNGHLISLQDPWDFEEVYAQLHDFASGYAFDPENEEYLVHITTGTHVAQICLFLLTESRHLPARLLQSSPPKRSTQVASGSYRIIDLDLSRYDALATRFQAERLDSVSFLKNGISTRNSRFNSLIEQVERVSQLTKAPILLTGPTGAGKSQLAKRIFQLKRNRGQVRGKLVDVNCATIRGEQAMSALFGHTKGAFTGAVGRREGLLKAADGGVLFLDEVGELGLDEQAMLLRAIEEKIFTPVGSDEPTTSDFQLIAGTNRLLHQRVASGHFRDDLLARINLWSFELPSLVERPEDIDPNIDFELQRFSAAEGRNVTMNLEARRMFLDYALAGTTPWAGNFRDLSAAITRMTTLCSNGRINQATIAEEIERLRASANRQGLVNDNAIVEFLGADKLAEIDRFDQVQLAEVLRVCKCSTSLSEAGRTLFAHTRLAKRIPNDADRLRKYLARFKLSWSDIHAE